MTKKFFPTRKPQIALLIAGHNEAKVIGRTITSAIDAGLSPEHIYIVDDNSNDGTAYVARTLLHPDNVISVTRSGKGLALSKASKHFGLTKRYRWIHIADADGGFGPKYFTILRRELRVKYAAATGYVTSTRSSLIGDYRVMEYTMGMDIVRRFQSFGKVISVIPGPSSCFRADVFEKLDFTRGALAEDFCVTLQIHRENLGPIQFIEDAIVYTQDPQNFKDFFRQIRRWDMGILQGIRLYKIGLHPSRLDTYLMYQIAQNLFMFFIYAIWLPLLAIGEHNPTLIARAFLVDLFLMALILLICAVRAKRYDILGSFPNIYAMRWVSLGVFMMSLVQTIFTKKHRLSSSKGIWQPVARKAVS